MNQIRRIKLSDPNGSDVFSVDIPEDNRLPLFVIKDLFPQAVLIGFREEDSDMIRW